MVKPTLKDREELTFKKRFEDLQDRLKSPLDELMIGRLVLEYEKNGKVEKLERELSELRIFKNNFGKNDFEKSVSVLLKMFKEIARQNQKLELTEKNRMLLLKENIKLKKQLNSEKEVKTCATKHVIPPKSKDSGILPNFT